MTGPRPRRNRSAARLAGEEGFTLVEMMVALSLMAVAMVAISGVFFTGLKAASASGTRTSAVALATRETEAIRAVPYDEVGFYDDQLDQQPSFESATTVSLGATTPAAVNPRLEPTGTATVGPVTYSIRRHLVWVAAKGPSTTYPEAYKKTVVIVTWRDGSGPHTVRQDSIIYPGGLGTYTGAGSVTTTTSSTTVALMPAQATITSVVTPTSSDPAVAPLVHSQLDVTWTAPPANGAVVTAYIVQWSTDSSFTTGTVSSPPQPASATSYQAAGLAATQTYHFRVVAYSGPSLSSTSAVVSGTTLAAPTTPAPTCQVTSLTLSGAGNGNGNSGKGLSTKTYFKRGSNELTENLELVLTSNGTCTGTFTVRGESASGVAALHSPYAMLGSGTTLTATIGASTAWPAVGIYTFTVFEDGVQVDPVVQKTFLFCSWVNKHSSGANEC